MRYTLDGTTPTESSGTLISASSGTVPVTSTAGGTVLKTIAFKSGWITSAVGSATYSMPQVAMPTYNPPSGLGSASYPITVTITTATAGANMRYTLNGTTPTENRGTLIAASSGTVSITTGGTVLKAVAFKSGWIVSAIKSTTYTATPIDPPPGSTPPPEGADGPGIDSNYTGASYKTGDNARRALRASAVSRGATSPKIATSRSAGGSGSNYILASYQTGGDTGTASSASAVSPNTTTTAPTTTSSTTPVNVYLYAGDQIIENVTMGHFYYQDSLGNTSHVTDAAGNLLGRYTYSAFGIPTFYNSLTPNGGSASALGIKHLFQGQLWTQETGLNDYRNRVELPIMGVFLQPDPIGFKGDAANIYRFCNNNAVNRIDPMGLIDSNNFDPNTPDYTWAQRADLHRFSDLFSYGAHGGDHDYNYGQALNPAYRSTGQTIPLNTVIASIKGNPIFQNRSGTLLIVCNSGADRSTFARSVAMGTGKDVLAPSKYLWLLNQKNHPFVVAGGYRDSRTGELKMNKNDPGHLTRFHPDGSSKAGADYKISARDAKGAIPVGGSSLDNRSSSPTAVEVDAAHQATTGVPSLGAESVNFAPGKP